MKRSFIALALAAIALLGIASPASAAHNSNNKAELTGTTDPDITGVAIVNYQEGRGTFNGSTRVDGLEPGEDYTFRVTGPGGLQTICTFTANASGSGGCSEQGLKLGGFTTAQIVDKNGTVVASGTFARRGTCRDPQQGGELCEAPGQDV